MKHPFIFNQKGVFQNHTFSVEMMSHILDNHNHANRVKSKPNIIKMVADIQSGNWMDDTGNLVTFDWNGDLVSGQKRFEAHIIANKSFKADVMYGLNPQVRIHTDDAQMRDLSTRYMTAEGIEMNSKTSLMQRKAFSICRMLKKAEVDFTQLSSFPDDELIDILTSKRKYIDLVLNVKKPHTTDAGVLAAIVLYIEKRPKLGEKFMNHVLGDGSGLQPGCPALFIRNHVTQRANGGAKSNDRYKVTVSAIHKYNSGETMTRALQMTEWTF